MKKTTRKNRKGGGPVVRIIICVLAVEMLASGNKYTPATARYFPPENSYISAAEPWI